jgi:hypothetical protein
MNCEYCHGDKFKDGYCSGCGAKISEAKKADWKSEPFFYNGYICYKLRHYERDTYEIQFWLGMELIERIEITHDVFVEKIPPQYDSMAFFWELFLLAHGEKNVLEWQEKNNKYPARFLVTRVENPETEYMRALNMYDLAKAVIK